MAEMLSPALPNDIEQLAETVLKRACEREWMLVTAESCTGGVLASLLTDVVGCSHAFERGFVTYTNHAKHEMLGVPTELLADPGPVSEIAARKMAEGALAHSRGQIAVSVTGFAGPGEAPGLVHFGCAVRGGQTTHRREKFACEDRAGVRLEALRTSLQLLQERLG